jgi:hypothetical protein
MKYCLLLVCGVYIMLGSCAAPSYAWSSGRSHRSVASYDGGSADVDKMDQAELFAAPHGQIANERMMIYNANMTLKVKSSAETNTAIESIAAKYQGYIVSTSNYNSILRVKADQLNAALADIALLGKVTSKTVKADDVMNAYTDLGIRLDNAEKARARYLELLARAENVQAALLVEKELERLNTEIDMLKGNRKNLEHLEAYSTISVRINEKEKLGVLGYVFVGLYKGVRWLFVRG